MSRAALPFVVATGVMEVLGYWCFAFAARESIALASVLSSMFAPIAAVAAYVVFRERLSRRQVIGIALVVCGVAALGILQA
jgi:drug/metabolite transporter (DMT)-like permease